MKLPTVLTVILCSLPPLFAAGTSVRIARACIVAGRPFAVNIVNSNPKADDWVGIFPASQATSTITRSGIGWDFACGTKSCQGKVSQGTVSISTNVSPGLYKAVLARNGVKTFQAIAVSQTVRVVTNGDACAGPSPVASPVASPPTAPVLKKPTSGGPKPGPVPNSGNFNSIFTDKSTYAFGEKIKVSFTSGQPKPDDFIAIYPAVTNNRNLKTGELWLFTCGRQGANVCSSGIPSGSVTFGVSGNPSTWGVGWPLLGGNYVAYLVRNNFVGPFPVIAQSGVFTIQSNAAPGSNLAARTALRQVQATVANMVFQNRKLIAKFLRLGFHDCVGGVCDGCVDLLNPDNNGLEFPIDVLTPVVNQFANNRTGLSRADIWATAAQTAVHVAGHGATTQPISFPTKWYGRVDCGRANKVCHNGKGVSVPCIAKRGPDRILPGVNLNSKGIMDFFRQNFNFDERQTIVIMGAHTVGVMTRSESGIDGPNGWTINNVDVHNEYYDALIGAASLKSTDAQIYIQAPAWKRAFLENSHLGVPDRHFWRLNVTKHLSMTNADLALIRDLNNNNMNPSTGAVGCAFRPSIEPANVPVCSILKNNYQIIATFKGNNDLWLMEFRDALDLVLTTGYNKGNCAAALCKMTPK